jgi:hypothetical protein
MLKMGVKGDSGCCPYFICWMVVFSSPTCAYEEGEDQAPVEATQESEVHL